jgi:hypothetical protein
MKNILEKLYLSLKDELLNQLKVQEQRNAQNGELDVFKTYLTISKSQRDFRNLIESSAINKDVLESEFSREELDDALKSKLIKRGNNLQSNKVYISSNGLYEYYRLNNLNLNDVFIAFDDYKFSQDKLRLKIQEKLFCIFLMLFDACSSEKALDTNGLSNKVLEDYFVFLKSIEFELESTGLVLGKKVNWGSGKDISFRKFITNNVDLPNTGVYNDRPTAVYWIDFSNRRNVTFLVDLILDNYDGDQRVLANALLLETLRKLSNRMLIELGEIPNDLNSYLVQELSN